MTSIYYWVPGNKEFCVAPSKAIVGQVNFVVLVALSDDEDLQKYVWS